MRGHAASRDWPRSAAPWRRLRGRPGARARRPLRLRPRRRRSRHVVSRRADRVLELRSVRGTGGGPEKTILLGAARHDRDRFAITVCYLRDARDDVFGIDERARAARTSTTSRSASATRSIAGIWPAADSASSASAQIDIVHAHDYKTEPARAGCWRAPARHRPLATAHGWTGHSRAGAVASTTRSTTAAARGFRASIAVSSEIATSSSRRRATRIAITVLLNGIDPGGLPAQRRRERAACARRWASPPDDVVDRRGRPAGAAEAVRPAARRLRGARGRADPRLRLVIVGDGSLRASAAGAQADGLGLGGACRFLGHRTTSPAPPRVRPVRAVVRIRRHAQRGARGDGDGNADRRDRRRRHARARATRTCTA